MPCLYLSLVSSILYASISAALGPNLFMTDGGTGSSTLCGSMVEYFHSDFGLRVLVY